MTDTTAAVTAAREALASIDALHPTAKIAVGSSTHGGAIQYEDGCRVHGAWCREWSILRRDTAKLRDLLAVVDRLTAPVAREDVDAALDALDEQYGTITMTEIRHLVGPLRTFVAAAIVAASGRRHLPTEPEYEYGVKVLPSEDAPIMTYSKSMQDHLIRRGHQLYRRTAGTPAGPWEVCDEQ